MKRMLVGQITGAITSFSTVLSQLKAGKVRGIAVATTARSPMAPELPTLRESLDRANELITREFIKWEAAGMTAQ